MESKNWSNQVIYPNRDKPSKVDIRYPCPGVSRFLGMVSFLIVGLGIYNGGISLFNLKQLNWSAPVWTWQQLCLIVAACIFGIIAGFIGFGYGMTIKVRNEHLNDCLIILWQFLANGSIIWVTTIGIAMSLTLGKVEAKAMVLNFGIERATVYVLGTGSILGLLLGITFFVTKILRIPFILYLSFSIFISLLAARWHYQLYNIQGRGWVFAGIITIILLLFFTPSMIRRDQQQRKLIKEGFSQNRGGKDV